ncbi:MAG: GGDEF domain-containing protein [Bacilli bacterium]
MKNKKIILAILVVILLSLIGGIVYYLNRPDKNTTLTILEKQWIENNKNKVIDFTITNDVPIYSYNGNGIIFDFLDDFKNDTNIEFNKSSINDSDKVENGFIVVDKLESNDLLLHEDNYAIISGERINYMRVSEINNLVVGTLKDDLDKVNNALNGSYNLVYKAFNSYDELFVAVKSGDVNAIAVPKLFTMDKIIANNLNINYTINSISDKYVIRLGDNKKLNTIIKKYFKKWHRENAEVLFGENLVNNYFTFSQTAEKDRVNFRSKRYVYGFVNNAPFDTLLRGKLSGINNAVIKKFAKMTNIEITYKEYSNFSKLLNAFNSNDVDFFYDMTGVQKFKTDVYQTTNFGDNQVVILSKIDNDNLVLSLSELNNHSVLTLNNTVMSQLLNDNKIKFKGYNTINALLKNVKDDSVLVVDSETYNYFVRNSLKEFKVDSEITLENGYKYTIRDIKANKVFSQFFDFYLSFINQSELINDGYIDVMIRENNFNLIKNIVVYLLAIMGIISLVLGILKRIFKPREHKSTLSKEEKLKYIDMLTSLKNRNYLNDNIEKWDASEVYPQGIIIVDLNNVAYINDNYGHSEGDNVIKEAANVLIKTQIENSEIVRTNGNEFLIYTVGYDEKHIIAYIKKLNKELKTIAHGFGAAIGYSIINDAIKTIDDAVNEATLDMRNNKQELNNN